MLEPIIDYISGNKYLFAAVIFIVFYILSELVVLISEKIFLRFARKTKTDLDNILVKRTSKPISLLLVAIGIKLSLASISLPEKASFIASGISSSFFMLVLVYLIYSIIDTLIKHWGVSIAKKTSSTMDDHLVALLSKMLKLASAITIFLLILNVWGIEIGPLLAGLGIGGIAVAFALQSTLGNIFGGVSLILDKNVSIGEYIALDQDTMGVVRDVGLRSTKIQTFNNEIIIVPNSELANKRLQNIAQPDPSARVVISFGVAYGSKVEKVKDIVLKEISKIKGIDSSDEDKKPFVRFIEMGDSALLFKAFFWMDDYTEKWRAMDEANTLIYNALNKNKIEIPFPQMDVHVKRR